MYLANDYDNQYLDYGSSDLEHYMKKRAPKEPRVKSRHNQYSEEGVPEEVIELIIEDELVEVIIENPDLLDIDMDEIIEIALQAVTEEADFIFDDIIVEVEDIAEEVEEYSNRRDRRGDR